MNEQQRIPASARPGGPGDIWTRGLFWAWNLIFLAFMLFGFAPLQLPQLIESVRNGITPPSFLVIALVVIAIPVAAVLVGFFFLRPFPDRLFALGYVVEWPLLLILLFRFSFIRQGNAAITVLLVWLAVAEAAFLWHLFDRRLDERPPLWIHVRLAGLTLLFAGTLYAAVWLALYVPPLVAYIFNIFANTIRSLGDLFRNFPSSHWYDFPLGVLGFVLLFFSATLVAVMPVAAPILAGRAWMHSLRRIQKAGSRPSALASAILPLALVLVVLGVSMVQPQQKAFKLLEKAPATLQEAEVLVQHSEEIRLGLLNTYLAPFRYMSSVGEVRHVNDMYEYALNFSEAAAWRMEQAYEVVIRPLLYEPVHPVEANRPDNQVITGEAEEAAVLYQKFFDKTIAEGEREEIVEAVRSNSNSMEAQLAWQAVDDREVHLNRQEIRVTEHGDWAEVQIHEVYQNVTSQRQEVVYYFSLPESAVVTGLWLGNNAIFSQAFAYQVAPRGAAQAVYRNEIRYNRDPALLEQIGPRQYRLRVFPLEPGGWDWDTDEFNPGPELHVWMAYSTLAVESAWPLPQLAERRNVYWDRDTQRLIDGELSPVQETAWMPEALPAAGPVTPAPHRVDFPDGQSVLILPADSPSPGAMAGLPGDLRLAVVLDRSFSMREKTNDVKQAIARVIQATETGPEPDVFLTSSKYRGEASTRINLASLDPERIFYFGGQNAAELLAQFQELQAGQPYDVILVLTDNTGYELGQGEIQLQVPDAPVWVVHLGGFPLGYDDPTQQAIQASGGGIAATVEEALVRYAAARYAAGREAPGQFDLVDGYSWQVLPTREVDALAQTLPVGLRPAREQAGFAALAARRLVLAEMARNHDRLDQLPVLDALNELAVEQGIVTPYSSMIVLVNQPQKDLLEELSQMGDRYRREVEAVGDTLQANPFAVTGVPEPEEWLLLILAGLVLGAAAWRKLKSTGSAPIRAA